MSVSYDKEKNEDFYRVESFSGKEMARNTYVQKAPEVLRKMPAGHLQIAMLRCGKRSRHLAHWAPPLPLRERQHRIRSEWRNGGRTLGSASERPLGSSSWPSCTPALQS